MKNSFTPPPHLGKQALNGFKCLIAMLFISNISSAQINQSATSWSAAATNIYSTNSGNVGIGTTNPLYKLHVFGDAYISNNLFVGGGIIVADRLNAAESVTTSVLTADTLSSAVVTGNTKFTGNIDAVGDMTVGAVDASTLTTTDVVTTNKLTIGGNATFNGSLKIAPLAGTSDRLLYIDPLGNLKTSASTAAAGPFWETTGNAGTNPLINFLGTTDQNDLVIKTTSVERMRILANGDINFSTGAGMVIQSHPNVFNPPFTETHVGIGTYNPVRSLHIYTEHMNVVNTQTNVITGSHNGMRLEDLSGTTSQPIRSIWDILPNNKSLLFSKGDPSNPHALNVKMIITDNGNVGIGTTAPLAKLQVAGTGLFSDKVGIGTNAPVAKLEVLESSVNQLGLVVGDLTGKSLMVVPNLGGGGYNPLSNNADVGIIFRNQNGNAGNAGLTIAPHSAVNSGIRIAPNGDVGIGTTAPLAKLQVAGTSLFSDKVGIGTNAPTAKLEVLESSVNQLGMVVGDLTGKSLMVVPNLGAAGYNPLSNNADVGIIFRNQNGNAGNAGLTIAPHSAVNSGIRIAPNGYVGIGTPAPLAKLQVSASGSEIPFEIINTTSSNSVFKVGATGQTFMNQTIINSSGFAPAADMFIITNDPGNIMSLNTNFKIKANGDVLARSIRVMVGNFPDYVFAKDYKLAQLSEVESFYKQNKRLPKMPGAAEVEKNGLDVGEINRLLVEKTEELTIYVVEQNKKVEALQVILKKQEAMLLDLQKQVDELKKK